MKRIIYDRVDHDGALSRRVIDTPPNSAVRFDANGELYAPGASVRESFDVQPAAAVAAGTSPFFLLAGTSAIIARAATGGSTLTTKSSTPAAGDRSSLEAVAATTFAGPVTAASLLQFRAVVRIPTITTLFASAGLNENVGDVDPTGTAGDGASFLFCPAAVKADLTVATGFSDALHANWLLATKVAGADAYLSTSVPVVAGQDYELAIVISRDLKPAFYIDGVLVGTAALAQTASAILRTVAGVETRAGSQRDLTVRYLELARQWG